MSARVQVNNYDHGVTEKKHDVVSIYLNVDASLAVIISNTRFDTESTFLGWKAVDQLWARLFERLALSVEVKTHDPAFPIEASPICRNVRT